MADMEYLVHASRTVAGFHRLGHRELDEVLAATLPRRSVMLALDGPAPLAKLLLQRCVAVLSRLSQSADLR